MTTQLSAKIRLVKCPRCCRVLPELSNVPVYRCGGCNAVLRVKRQNNGTVYSGPDTHEVDLSQKNELQCDSEDKETQVEALTGELQLDKVTGNVQGETKVIDDQESEDVQCFGSCRESFAAATEDAKVDIGKFMPEHINGGGQDREQIDGQSLSVNVESSIDFRYHGREEENNPFLERDLGNDVNSSVVLDIHQNEGSSAVDEACGENGKCLEKISRSDQSESEDCDEEESETSAKSDAEAISRYIFGNFRKGKPLAVKAGDSVLSGERLSTESTSTEDLMSPLVESQMRKNVGCDPVSSEEMLENIVLSAGSDPNQSGDCNKDFPANQKSPNQVSPSNGLTCQELGESSPVVGTPNELEEDSLSRFIFGSFKEEKPLVVSSANPHNSSQWLSGESNLNENLISPHNEQLEHSQMRESNDLVRANSEKASETIAITDHNSVQGVNYAYDGSASSFGETDDHDPNKYMCQLKGKYKEAECSETKSLPAKDLIGNKFTSRYPDSILTEKKPYPMKGLRHCKDQYQESTGNCRPVSSRMQFGRDEHSSRAPFSTRACPIGSEYGSSSNHGRNRFYCCGTSNLPPMPENPKEENMKLQKLVLELLDQLNRSHMRNGHASGRSNHIPPCHLMSQEMDMRPDLSNSGCANIRCQKEGFPNQGRFSRIPYSAEATIGRHQTGHSCLNCYPHDWHCSAPMPPHVCCNPSQCTFHPNQNHCNIHCSCFSSPLHCVGSQFSLKGCNMMCANHWSKHHEEKKHFRERNHAVKRHVLPVKGGAPFVVCYRCSELLQLPTDFLLFRKRCHRLRCNACSFILKFSLHNGSHLDIYMDSETNILAPAPPPSEVDDFNDAYKGKKLTLDRPHVDPVCTFDDYGPSTGKSCSTEGEPLPIVLPFDVQKGESSGIKMISVGDVERHTQGRKHQAVPVESQSRYKDRISEAEKPSKGIETVRPRNVSPLHRLMGYNSAREVLKG